GTPADISVSASAPASSVTGLKATVTFTVQNVGPNTAAHVTLLGSFSLQPVLVSTTPSQGSCTIDQAVRCDLGQMASGASVAVSVSVIPTVAGSLGGKAVVGSSLPDPKTGNNTATANIRVTGAAYNVVPVLAS